ncbi:outer membrane autotransporter protein [Rhizobium sp. BK529]|uniref:autotransporter outer membrane beta-barrel domain-containing protein n=1 Tax=unclassified Rhizobium TaxID=2613769 RepID=UPI00104F331B|nr:MULTISPECIES: autotransporter outer membrane beta-barrel domain-containing protein [unclassified Rhizobium]MBB3594213.1 outer membrane autotransporter protein [Rhizobium sp. BK529]TCS01669.1 outer membrane autotransporter protein [Rhizobium sp. BK418]
MIRAEVGGRSWAVVAAMLLSVTTFTSAGAQSLSFGPTGGGGSGTWDSATVNWFNGSVAVPWASGGTAIFGGTPGTVAVNGTVSVGGVTFDSSGYTITGGTLALTGATPTITTNAGVSATISSAISGSATLVKSGAGALTFSGAKTYTGATIVDAGQLVLRNPSGFVSPTTVNSGATLTFTGTTSVTTAAPITLNDGATLEHVNPSGYVQLTGAVTSTGNTSINVNTIGTGRGFYLDGGLKGSGTVTINAASAGNAVILRNNNSTFSGTLVVNGIASATAGAGSGLALAGLATSNALINTNVVLNGTIELADQGMGSGFGTAIFNMGSLSGSGIMVANRNPIGNFGATIVLGNTNDSGLFSGSIVRGSGRTNVVGVTKVGTGTQIFSGANSYTGVTNVNAGVLNIRNSSALGSTVAGTNVASGAALQIEGGITVGAEALTLNGTGIANDGALRNISGVNSYGGPITLGSAVRINSDAGVLTLGTIMGPGQNLTLGGAGNVSVTGVLGITSGTLTKDGSGTAILSATNTYTGATIINGGTLQAGAAAGGRAFGTLSAVTLADVAGTTLNLDGFDQTIGSLSGGGTTGGNVTLGSGTLTTGGNGTSTAFGGVISGAGAFVKVGSGTQILTGTSTYSGGTTISDGALQLGNGGTSGSIIGDVINSGALIFDRADSYTFSGLISGNGSVDQIGAGTMILTGSNTYTGPTSVAAGSLIVNGDQSGAIGLTTVANGATLGGTGTIGGDVSVANGGIIDPGNPGSVPGTLTINGNLALSNSSNLNYNFGQANVVGGAFNDLTKVGGDLTLDGTLNVTQSAGGSFMPGIYRVISYDGTLANNGLALGTMPTGNFLVQTSVDKQVNLVNATGITLNFWDGPGGTSNDGSIHGGDGVWRLTDNDHWTNDTGLINAPYSNGAFAVFEGQSGTVSVDNGNGQIQASGMQFATDGYVIDGQPLTLVGGSSIVRVGDGTLDGANMTATIVSALAGSSTLVKADLGTLVLSGLNTYTGGTSVQGGTLQVSADANFGDAAGGITLDGGTLHSTSSFESNRGVTLASTGTFLTDAGTVLTLNGNLNGAGGFAKTGTGTLLLNGTSSYGGATTVTEGTLQAGSAGAFSPSSAFSVGADGTLNLAGFDQTVASLTNAGTAMMSGRPGTTLTVTGNYEGAGGTLILNTVLGADGSATDRLVVGGNTAGNTTLRVANVGGGGAQTVNGIKVVDVGGASNGTFSLQGDYVYKGDQAVVGGAYAYRLYKGGVSTPADGDWYLRSALTQDPSTPLYQPGVPLYEAYAGSLQTFNRLGTLQQRVGNRTWIAGGEERAREDGNDDSSGIWARFEAGHADFEPGTSTSGSDYDATTWRLQTGADGLLHENDFGRLIAGASFHYGRISSDVTSVYGNGNIDTTGIGLDGTLTWYGNAGFYVDAQAQVTWYGSDLYSTTATRSLVNDNDGMGYALGIEAGQRIALDSTWALTPQAQLTYSSVRFDDFTDPFAADVALDRSRSLVGRLGLAVEREVEWQEADGKTARSHLYGIANLYHDFADGSRAEVAGTPFTSENDPWRGGVGLGGSINWSDDKYSLYGEALASTSLQNFGNSNNVSGTVGFRVRW